MDVIQAEVLIDGTARGRVLRLSAPIGFWGGVDPETGRIIDPRHPNHGGIVAGRVLVVPATVGSSSSSAVMLELLRRGRAPAALILGARDAILPLGVLVARELGYTTIPVLLVAPDAQAALTDDAPVDIAAGGSISTG